MIEKAGGGERPLGIPTIRDRVVQTAAKLVLEPIFEADLEPGAYAVGAAVLPSLSGGLPACGRVGFSSAAESHPYVSARRSS